VCVCVFGGNIRNDDVARVCGIDNTVP